jgi:hypothetical protein
MQLHEQTQRFILLLIFYLFGPILTLGIIGGIVVRKLPSNARHWEQTLTQQTGLYWKIQSVEYCSPKLVRLHSVQILDEITKVPVFEAKKLEIKLVTDSRRNKIFPEIQVSSGAKQTGLTAAVAKVFPSYNTKDQFWQITAPVSILNFGKYSSVESASLVQNMLGKIFARFSSLADIPVLFVFEQIIVVSEHSLRKEGDKIEDKIDVLRLVQGNIYRTPTEIRSDWYFQIKDISELDWEHREHLSFTLSLTDTLEISFRSGRQPIPCDLAAVFCSPFQHFSGGSFQGEFSVSTRAADNSHTTRLNKAVFKNMPLAPLARHVTKSFPVEGTVANLELTSAVFGTEGKHAIGHLHVVNGEIDSALFARCVGRFRLTVNPNDILDQQIPMVKFTACAVHFHLQPEGINFWADSMWGDAIMYHRENPHLPFALKVHLPQHRKIVTYHELMSIFAPDNAPTIPMTLEMQSLAPHIPFQ